MVLINAKKKFEKQKNAEQMFSNWPCIHNLMFKFVYSTVFSIWGHSQSSIPHFFKNIMAMHIRA